MGSRSKKWLQVTVTKSASASPGPRRTPRNVVCTGGVLVACVEMLTLWTYRMSGLVRQLDRVDCSQSK